jgi:hypothetical protein
VIVLHPLRENFFVGFRLLPATLGRSPAEAEKVEKLLADKLLKVFAQQLERGLIVACGNRSVSTSFALLLLWF